MKYFLMKYADNWADEMDVEGHCILTEEQKDKFQIAAENTEGFSMCIGTNEDIEYEDVDSILSAVEFTEITEEQYKVLQDLELTSTGFAEHFYDYVVGGSDCDWDDDWDQLEDDEEEE